VQVGILELLAMPAQGRMEAPYDFLMVRQFASVTPQAIACWCRRLGHRVFYAIYHGLGSPERLLPDDLDIVFISAYTQASPLAYAVGRLYRRRGVRTVFGGAHAKSFPVDCLRFFDLVVEDCDEALVADILGGMHDPGTIVSSPRPFDALPTVEERMPEIAASAFLGGRPYFGTQVPLLASVGCPYDCGFCIDWNTRYRLLSPEQLAADLAWMARRLPGVMVSYHDPNFAVKFDQVLDVIERVPASSPNPYIVETSLSVLSAQRIARLGRTGCAAVVPGVETWGGYSQKAGATGTSGGEKLARVLERFELLHEHVRYLQANFMFGLDDDEGDEPVRLTKAFMDQAPYVWPAINIPHPFGGTPLQAQYLAEDRILREMPFAFYYAPYLVTRLKHYGAAEYYRKLIELFDHLTRARLLARRMRTARGWLARLVHVLRTGARLHEMQAFRRILRRLEGDHHLRAFQNGESTALPEFYDEEYDRLLGAYSSLIPREERRPILDRPHDQATRPAVIHKEAVMTGSHLMREYSGGAPAGGTVAVRMSAVDSRVRATTVPRGS
jgi:radical SAM superfamily enzyme YgiQ (UPF0313 family)